MYRHGVPLGRGGWGPSVSLDYPRSGAWLLALTFPHRSHRALNACLAPLYSVESCAVTTVEGLGNVRAGLHPVQSRLANSHGSQCGFCTPGFIMSMYSLLRTSKARRVRRRPQVCSLPGAGMPEVPSLPLLTLCVVDASTRAHAAQGQPSEAEIEDTLAGNLCRCTGYRPILEGFRAFAKTEESAYTQEALAAAGAAPMPLAATMASRNGSATAAPMAPRMNVRRGMCLPVRYDIVISLPWFRSW